MQRRMLLLSGLGLAMPARAAMISGVGLPDTYPLPGRTLVLNGLGIRYVTFLSIRAYVAGLYLSQRTHDAGAILASREPRVIMMQFLHSASKSEVAAQYHEGEQRNCGHGECPRSDEPDFERLIAVTPPLNVGDTLTYIYMADGVRMLFNNRPIVEIANPDLAFRLLSGFIGPKPPSETLKEELLGLKQG